MSRPELDQQTDTVIEIVQHAAGILASIPLASARTALQGQLAENRPDNLWTLTAMRVIEDAMTLELSGGRLALAELERDRPAPTPPPTVTPFPDDWHRG